MSLTVGVTREVGVKIILEMDRKRHMEKEFHIGRDRGGNRSNFPLAFSSPLPTTLPNMMPDQSVQLLIQFTPGI